MMSDAAICNYIRSHRRYARNHIKTLTLSFPIEYEEGHTVYYFDNFTFNINTHYNHTASGLQFCGKKIYPGKNRPRNCLDPAYKAWLNAVMEKTRFKNREKKAQLRKLKTWDFLQVRRAKAQKLREKKSIRGLKVKRIRSRGGRTGENLSLWQ